mmetsp:Transcript_112732/g.176079  ORF Transcript_112732/g.176079 Transcript_112732/m.176079 type:complete len:143 (-) Transcript_112732:393-821(-)
MIGMSRLRKVKERPKARARARAKVKMIGMSHLPKGSPKEREKIRGKIRPRAKAKERVKARRDGEASRRARGAILGIAGEPPDHNAKPLYKRYSSATCWSRENQIERNICTSAKAAFGLMEATTQLDYVFIFLKSLQILLVLL